MIKMKVVTFNANGIRSAARKGFYDWMLKEQPDFVCIQELKAQEHQLPDEMLCPGGYHGFLNCAKKKGYSGTAVYSKIEPRHVTLKLGWEEFDDEGRMVRVDYERYSVISLYLPSGTSSDDRQQFKEEVLTRLQPLLIDWQKDEREFIICGDVNIAHRPADLRNWRGNRKNSGFLPQERSWMDWLFNEAGYVDAFRVVDTRPGRYTWWSNRGEAYAKNVGWRLDYQIVTKGLRSTVNSASVYTDVKFSDHAPLTLDYEFS